MEWSTRDLELAIQQRLQHTLLTTTIDIEKPLPWIAGACFYTCVFRVRETFDATALFFSNLIADTCRVQGLARLSRIICRIVPPYASAGEIQVEVNYWATR